MRKLERDSNPWPSSLKATALTTHPWRKCCFFAEILSRRRGKKRGGSMHVASYGFMMNCAFFDRNRATLRIIGVPRKAFALSLEHSPVVRKGSWFIRRYTKALTFLFSCVYVYSIPKSGDSPGIWIWSEVEANIQEALSRALSSWKIGFFWFEGGLGSLASLRNLRRRRLRLLSEYQPMMKSVPLFRVKSYVSWRDLVSHLSSRETFTDRSRGEWRFFVFLAFANSSALAFFDKELGFFLHSSRINIGEINEQKMEDHVRRILGPSWNGRNDSRGLYRNIDQRLRLTSLRRISGIRVILKVSRGW